MTHRTRDLLAVLRAHRPRTDRERASLETIQELLRELPRPFDEDADRRHVTASAIVVDGRGRTVLHLHKRLGLWLQPGGHLDAGEAPADGALREATEETGLAVRHLEEEPRLVHVDVHETDYGHVHLDLRYLLFGPSHGPLEPDADESPHLEWLPYDEACERTDGSAADAIAAVRELLPTLGLR